jgi:hypothetical protein
MNLDQLLHDALHDDRLALPVPAGTLDAVRRKRRTRQRLAIAGTSVAAVTLVGGAVSAATLLSSSSSTLSPYATGGVPVGSAAPSISPSWIPSSGNDWLLTDSEYRSFSTSHTRAPYPSPGPGQGRVPSPAPLTSRSELLLQDVQGGNLPSGTSYRREDSPGGDPDETDVHVTLPDGTPVEVFRRNLDGPFAFHQNAGDGVNPGATEEQVPGTSSGAALYPNFGYSFGAKWSLDGNGAPIGAHGVVVVSRGGVATTWAAPSTVPLTTLKEWAYAAAQHAGD